MLGPEQTYGTYEYRILKVRILFMVVQVVTFNWPEALVMIILFHEAISETSGIQSGWIHP
jgi:hypothetical protein